MDIINKETLATHLLKKQYSKRYIDSIEDFSVEHEASLVCQVLVHKLQKQLIAIVSILDAIDENESKLSPEHGELYLEFINSKHDFSLISQNYVKLLKLRSEEIMNKLNILKELIEEFERSI